MQRYRQKTLNMSLKCDFPRDPLRFFFENWALSLLHSYGALASCKQLEKPNEQSLRYSKTDHGTTDGQMDKPQTDRGDYIGPFG